MTGSNMPTPKAGLRLGAATALLLSLFLMVLQLAGPVNGVAVSPSESSLTRPATHSFRLLPGTHSQSCTGMELHPHPTVTTPNHASKTRNPSGSTSRTAGQVRDSELHCIKSPWLGPCSSTASTHTQATAAGQARDDELHCFKSPWLHPCSSTASIRAQTTATEAHTGLDESKTIPPTTARRLDSDVESHPSGGISHAHTGTRKPESRNPTKTQHHHSSKTAEARNERPSPHPSMSWADWAMSKAAAHLPHTGSHNHETMTKNKSSHPHSSKTFEARAHRPTIHPSNMWADWTHAMTGTSHPPNSRTLKTMTRTVTVPAHPTNGTGQPIHTEPNGNVPHATAMSPRDSEAKKGCSCADSDRKALQYTIGRCNGTPYCACCPKDHSDYLDSDCWGLPACFAKGAHSGLGSPDDPNVAPSGAICKDGWDGASFLYGGCFKLKDDKMPTNYLNGVCTGRLAPNPQCIE